MKEIAKHKAKEEKKKLESEVSFVRARDFVSSLLRYHMYLLFNMPLIYIYI